MSPTDEREKIRAWLAETLKHKGWSGSDLARKIGVVPSTINRFLNDPDYTNHLRLKTLRAIEDATGLSPFSYPVNARPGAVEAEQLRDDESSGDALIDEVMRQIRGVRGNIHFWQLRSHVLEAACCLPGDVLAVDICETPRAGDIVCAQPGVAYAERPEPVFRVYDPPYLVAAARPFRLIKTLIVDQQHVAIEGVVVNVLRSMRSKNT